MNLMAKYLNSDQRETLIWLNALITKFNKDAMHWPATKRKFLNEAIPYLEELMVKLMAGIDRKDGAAVVKLAGEVNPVLMKNDWSETDPTIKVDFDQFYTLAEWGLEYCKASAMFGQINRMTNAKVIKDYIKENWKCTECKDPESCKARKVFLHFLVPPLTDTGKCQYYRGDGDSP